MGNLTSYPNGFTNGVSIKGVPVLSLHSKNVYHVDSNATYQGLGTDKKPMATLDAAIGLCTANRGDIIMVHAGHSETVTTSIAADVAGIQIVGLGVGDTAPTFIGPNTDPTINVSAADIVIKGLRFEADAGTTQAGTQKIYVNAASCLIEGNFFQAGQYDDDLIYLTTSADYCKIINNEFWGTNADGVDTFIYLDGKTPNPIGVEIKGNWLNGYTAAYSPDLGHIYSSGVFTHCKIEDNRFLYMSAGGGIEFTQAATGIIAKNFFGGGVQDQMIDPGSCYCFENYETDAIDASGMLEPTVTS